jgi:hypothetical protein
MPSVCLPDLVIKQMSRFTFTLKSQWACVKMAGSDSDVSGNMNWWWSQTQERSKGKVRLKIGR